MGIKGLFAFIKKYAPAAITQVKTSQLSGMKLGIDVSLQIYQWVAVGNARKIVNDSGYPINHIQGALYRTVRLLDIGATPVYVFDGAPPSAKAGTIDKRKESRNRGDSVKVGRGVYAETAKLLGLLGVPVLQSPSEAEAEAAYLTQTGSIDAVVTEDTDALVFGAKKMIRGLNATSKSVTVIELPKILSELKLTHLQFVDLCILLGCDYTGTLPGIGPAKALDYMQNYGSIEAILAQFPDLADVKQFDYQTARNAFLKHPVEAHPAPFIVNPVNFDGLEIMLKEYTISETKIRNIMERLR